MADHEDREAALEGVREDLAEYEALHRAESERILRLCRMLLGDPDEAEDVRQEVFLKLHEAPVTNVDELLLPSDPALGYGESAWLLEDLESLPLADLES